MNTDFIKGVVVPILTPIDEEEKIDEARLRDQVDYVIEGGVLGILAFGSNGEFYVVEEDEMERGLKIMLDQAAGRVPVYFGIGAISTKKCCRLAKMAVEAGAAGISVLQPMFLKPTEAELYNHFKTIAESVPETPMLLYNNPGRVGYTMSAGLVERLALQSALEELPERERQVLLLRYYRGLTQARAAEVLGVSQVQISRLERRAVERLRQILMPPE